MTAWQKALQQAITEPKQLLQLLQLEEQQMSYWPESPFKLKVPRAYIEKMKIKDPNDPLLLECLPLSIEQEEVDGYTKDPLHEREASPVPGLLHKYHGRVLLTVTGVCPIHCRYCFRRHFPYQDHVRYDQYGESQLLYIRSNPEISEVIFSGGDPWVLSDDKLEHWLNLLTAIDHVSIIRFHTRMPILLPNRVTPELLKVLSDRSIELVVVTHVNHPSALSSDTAQALSLLKSIGVTLLNQSVLLKGINDDVKVLSDLSHKLFSQGVMPYYIHQLDKVSGAAHFQCTDERALELHKELQSLLPGYLVPRLVVEAPGKPNKVPMIPA